MNELLRDSPKPTIINWYRTPLDSKDFKELHQRSDWRGALQTLSHLGLLILSGGAVLYSSSHMPIEITALLIFIHGTFAGFMINAVHELGHGTVFRTKALNMLFVRVFAFLGWINFEAFAASHTRHHRYTLHPPDDLEVVLPYMAQFKHCLLQGIITFKGLRWTLFAAIRIAFEKFEGEWETTLFPEGSPERKAAIGWARTMLIGHALLITISFYFHLWMLPVVTSCNGICGTWLFNLCNNTQHIGLQDDVPDFRLCCRTFTLNPFVEFLYWHMSYHTEHHMYAAIPCYNLGRLHNLIKYDLPTCPHGLLATWKEITSIQEIQKTNPEYQHAAKLPEIAKPSLLSDDLSIAAQTKSTIVNTTMVA